MARIFIVEDDLDLAENLEEILKISGHTILGTEASGEHAYGKILELRPDLILLDVNLKGVMDGIELSELIKRKMDIPIILATAQGEDNIVRKASGIKYTFFLHKPFTIISLISSINFALLNFAKINKPEITGTG
jgi:DNA-binding response OmpR family regulator